MIYYPTALSSLNNIFSYFRALVPILNIYDKNLSRVTMQELIVKKYVSRKLMLGEEISHRYLYCQQMHTTV